MTGRTKPKYKDFLVLQQTQNRSIQNVFNNSKKNQYISYLSKKKILSICIGLDPTTIISACESTEGKME